MKASSVKFNRNESAELHRTIDELRIEIRRREADFSERIESLHAELRTRTEQMENLRGQADQNSRVYSETLTEVGRWSMAARTLAALVIAKKTDGARDVAEFICAIKD